MRPPASPFVEYDDDLCGAAIAASPKIFDELVLGFRVPIATVYSDRCLSILDPHTTSGSLISCQFSNHIVTFLSIPWFVVQVAMRLKVLQITLEFQACAV